MIVSGKSLGGARHSRQAYILRPASFYFRGKVGKPVQDFLVSAVDFAELTLTSVAILCLLSMW